MGNFRFIADVVGRNGFGVFDNRHRYIFHDSAAVAGGGIEAHGAVKILEPEINPRL